MKGKTCLITGGTNGIGKSAARSLAAMGATVIISGRSAAKAERVVDEIKLATGNQSVSALVADLALQEDVRRLAQEFAARHSRLDVLINNAGAVFLKRYETPDGLEMTFAVNHLSHFLLTNLLLDRLLAAAPARIINVSSAAHMLGRIDFADLQRKRSYWGMGAYGGSKLANILFTRELARRLDAAGVTANALHPGAVNTGFLLNNPGVVSRAYKVVEPLLTVAPEKGAETTVYLASSPQVEGVSGGYFAKCKPARTSRAAGDAGLARRLWDVSAELTGL